MEFLDYMLDVVGAKLTIITAAVAAVWVLVQFIISQWTKGKSLRFMRYHRLIRELVDPDDGRPLRLHRQIAVVFELRSFKHYYPVTRRILTGLRDKDWKGEDQRLLDEIGLTLEHIDGGKR